MKEILIKFESEEDYKRFIETVIEPEVIDGNCEFDASNDILIIKNLENI